MREVEARAVLSMATYHWRFGRAVRDSRALGERHGAAKEGTTQSKCKELVLVGLGIPTTSCTTYCILHRQLDLSHCNPTGRF